MFIKNATTSMKDDDKYSGTENTMSSDFAVVAYLPEWRYNGVDYEAIADHLTHLIFFSIEVDSQGEFAAMDR